MAASLIRTLGHHLTPHRDDIEITQKGHDQDSVAGKRDRTGEVQERDVCVGKTLQAQVPSVSGETIYPIRSLTTVEGAQYSALFKPQDSLTEEGGMARGGVNQACAVPGRGGARSGAGREPRP